MIADAPIQTDMLDETIVQQFERWKQTPGGRHVMQIAYALTARYARRFKQQGRTVSMKLIWEQLRDNVLYIRARAKSRGILIEQMNGFTLNNNFTAHVARHILKHKPEWDGLFELRELHAK